MLDDFAFGANRDEQAIHEKEWVNFSLRTADG